MKANAIGVQKDELHFLYELHPKFAAFPTFPVNLAFKRTDQDVYDFIARNVTGKKAELFFILVLFPIPSPHYSLLCIPDTNLPMYSRCPRCAPV